MQDDLPGTQAPAPGVENGARLPTEQALSAHRVPSSGDAPRTEVGIPGGKQDCLATHAHGTNGSALTTHVCGPGAGSAHRHLQPSLQHRGGPPPPGDSWGWGLHP